MSDATQLAVSAAISAHLADETENSEGLILTGYLCQAQFTSVSLMDEEMTGYQRLIQEGQNLTTSLGLVHYAKCSLEQYLTMPMDSE